MITRKALEILENNLVLTRNVNRQYDDSFAVEGAKIGSTLRIRLPDRALVTDGAALQVQDDNEQFTTLTVASQKHIGVNFTTAEMTMQLDDFAERVLKPRISQLAASIDADVANSFLNMYQAVGTPGTTPSSTAVLLAAQQKLNESAAVMSPRYVTVNPAANAALIEGMKGLFNPVSTISSQFKNGMFGEGILGYLKEPDSSTKSVHPQLPLQEHRKPPINMSRQLIVGNQGRTHQVGAYQGSFRGRERIAYQDLPSIHEIEQILEQLTANITLRTEDIPRRSIRLFGNQN